MEKCNLSPELIGVIIGGCIGIAGSAMIATLDWRKWRLDRKSQHLKAERDRYEKIFQELSAAITKGMETDTYDIAAITSLHARTPQNVIKAFEAMMGDKDRGAEAKRAHFLKISLAMQVELLKIDGEIKKLYE